MNRKIVIVISVTILLGIASGCPKEKSSPTQSSESHIWFDEPAGDWNEALPIGNGRLGAMVFGGVNEERLQLNEESVWCMKGTYTDRQGAAYLPRIRELLFTGKYREAEQLASQELMAERLPTGTRAYQTLGDLHINYYDSSQNTNYRRSLHLDSAMVRVQYNRGGTNFIREVFSSAVDQTIAVRLTASEPGKISFETELRGVRNSAHSNYATDYFRMDGSGENELVLTGKSADYLGIEGKLRYEARVQVKAEEDVAAVETQRRKEAAVEYRHEQASAISGPQSQGEVPDEPFVREGRKVGRNEACPCGSGKKYKHCHGQLT